MLQHETGDPRSRLLEVIRQVRRRWRLKLALRGTVAFLGATILALVAAGYALEALRFSPGAILAFRILLLVIAAGCAAWFLVRPMLRRVSDEQVALYLEEQEPSLEATIITALDAERAGRAHEVSPALARKLLEAAIDRVEQIQFGRRIERRPVRRYAAAAAVVVSAALAIFTFGPAYLRHAVSALLVVSRGVEAAAPYRIDVTPGDATVPKGADHTVTATLHGFDAQEARVMVRSGSDRPFEPVPMMRGETGAWDGILFDLARDVEYYVEASGVRSPTFTLKVLELPYVERLDLEYRYPSYTGLEPRVIEDGGDVAALAGTEVRLTVHPTMPTGSGRIVLHDGSSAPLSRREDGTLAGSFTARENGFYRIELDGPKGEKVEASPQYMIDVITDHAPAVSLSRPGRDADATPVEEFAVEVRADDDFAVRNVQLVYSINGGEEHTITLFRGGQPTPEVTAGHTFYLEELGVQPGDAVSYYARASDNDAVAGPKTATSDIYFVRVRPFGREFRQAQSMAGGGAGGAGGAGDVGALSMQQRQIIAGTFKVQRDRRQMGADKVKEALVVLALSQSRLREQVQGLVDRMNSRLVAPDPAFQKIAELLPLAVEQMKLAEAKLQAQNPQQALPPENKALQYLQQAEEEYELQVQVQRNAGGGGGGGAGSIAEDLAELFKLELDKMANQYEVNRQAMQQQADRQVDELAEKLRELARRQEQELRRQQQLQARQGGRDARGSELQRELAQQAEEAARQLERLSREQNRPDLARAARQMQQAADAMRRAAAGGDASAAGQAAAAAERLREVQRMLQGSQGQRAERDIEEAQRQAAALAEEHRDITAAQQQLPSAGLERQAAIEQLSQRTAEVRRRLGDLEAQLDRTAAEIAREAREASRRVRDAASQIRDDKMKEKLDYARQVIGVDRPELQEFGRTLNEQLEANFAALERRLAEAAQAIGPGGRDRTAEALDRARDLARGLDSLGRRMQETAERRAQQGQARGENAGERSESTQASQGGREQAGRPGQTAQQGGTGDGRPGVGATEGAWRDGAGGWGSRRPFGELTPEEIRQFRDEARRYLGEGRELREELRRQQIDARALDEILRRLRELEDTRTYRDVEELLALQRFVAEEIKRFEYTLRRTIGDQSDRAVVTGADEVPREFRTLVEEYYRSLSRGRPQ